MQLLHRLINSSLLALIKLLYRCCDTGNHVILENEKWQKPIKGLCRFFVNALLDYLATKLCVNRHVNWLGLLSIGEISSFAPWARRGGRSNSWRKMT